MYSQISLSTNSFNTANSAPTLRTAEPARVLNPPETVVDEGPYDWLTCLC